MRVMHAPQHVGQNIAHNARAVRALAPRSVGFTELDGGGRHASVSIVRKGLGPLYRLGVARHDASHSQEVPVAVRRTRRFRVTLVDAFQLSDDLPGKGIGNDRWMTIVEYERRGLLKTRKYVHIATHWNAALQNRETGELLRSDRVRTMAESAGPLLEVAIRRYLAAGFTVFVTGDFNYRRPRLGVKLWYWSPQEIFTRCGLAHREDGLDYIAWSRDMRLAKYTVIRPGAVNKSDHPWLIADLRRKR